MTDKEKEFLSRLRVTFQVEASEHLEALSRGLREWESGVSTQREEELIESLFRETHSLKGASRAVDLADTEALCQPLEGVFAALKRHALSSSPELFDLLHQTLNTLTVLTTDIDASPGRLGATQLARRLESAVSAEPALKTVETVRQQANPSEAEQPRIGVAESVRVSTTKLFSALWQAEELLQARLSAQQRLAEWKQLERDDIPKVLQARFTQILRASEKDVRALSRLVEEHVETTKQLLMLPVSTLTEGFPKLVRDLARDRGKEVELVIQGSDQEIDKRLLEELKDPLIHLLRNAVHHGAEDPGIRKSNAKPSKATVRLEFVLGDDRHWEIFVADDGPGLDREKIVAQAVALGSVTRESADQLDDDQKAALIFLSGISTSPVTEVAGRGLGLAIVQEKAQRMGGSVLVRSVQGQGTTFVLRLPLTLSTLRGVLIRVSGQTLLIPSLTVEMVKKVFPAEIRHAGDRPIFSFRERSIPIVHLASVLGLESSPAVGPIFIAVLSQADRCAAFQVDEIVGEQLVLVKSLELPLKRVRNIAGATILGSGKVVPVLNAGDLLDFSLRAPVASVSAPAPKTAVRIHILLADDSITSRSLFKTFLESAGHQVTSAVDGIDAWEKLQGGDFDLVISDVDMPRLDGVELTTRIRNDPEHKNRPVILITSLDSPQDRERGMSAGANAYLIKSRFDQKNLLEAVRRLA